MSYIQPWTPQQRRMIINQAELTLRYAAEGYPHDDEIAAKEHLRWNVALRQVEAERDTLQEMVMQLVLPAKRKALIEFWRDIQYGMETDEDGPFWCDHYRRWADALEGMPWHE